MNKRLRKIQKVREDFEDIKSQLGESYFTTEEDNPDFPYAVSGKGEEIFYVNNSYIAKFLAGDTRGYIYDVIKTDKTQN